MGPLFGPLFWPGPLLGPSLGPLFGPLFWPGPLLGPLPELPCGLHGLSCVGCWPAAHGAAFSLPGPLPGPLFGPLLGPLFGPLLGPLLGPPTGRQGLSGVGCWPAAQAAIELGLVAAGGRLPVFAAPAGRQGLDWLGCSPAAHGGNWPRSTLVLAPGLHGLSGDGFWSGVHSGNFDMSIWPVACVGWHGFCGDGSWPAWQGGNWPRSTRVLAPGLHGLSGDGF